MPICMWNTLLIRHRMFLMKFKFQREILLVKVPDQILLSYIRPKEVMTIYVLNLIFTNHKNKQTSYQ